MSKISSLTNRMKRIEQFIPKKGVDHPLYIISYGHIEYSYGNKYKSDNNICLLCGKDVACIHEPCEKKLSDIELQKFMVDKEGKFLLFIWHETDDPDDKLHLKHLKLETDIGQEYTDFVIVPDFDEHDNDVTVKIYDKDLVKEI